MSARNLDIALTLGKRGWPVVPTCWPANGGTCGCGRHHREKEVGKALLVRGKLTQGSIDSDLIAEWWTKWPLANVSVNVGPAGLLVVDPDTDEAASEATHLGLPGTLLRASRMPAYLYARPLGIAKRRRTKRGKSKAIDIFSDGQLVVHGRHRLGHQIQLVGGEPTVAPAWACELLSEPIHQPSPKSDLSRLRPSPPVDLDDLGIPVDLKLHIQNPNLLDGDRSGPLFADEIALFRFGLSPETVLSILMDPRFGISEKPIEKGIQWARKDMERALEAAEGIRRTNPQFVADLAVVENSAQNLPSGRSGAMDFHVFHAHMRIASRVGSMTYTASVRQISEMVCADGKTILSSHQRLIKAGRLTREAATPRQFARITHWHISCVADSAVFVPTDRCLGLQEEDRNTRLNIPYVNNVGDKVLFHEAWAYGGLGKIAFRVWLAMLPPRLLSYDELASELGVGLNRAQRLARKLRKAQLLQTSGTRIQAIIPSVEHLDEIAQQFGLAGLQKRLKHQHERERAAYQSRLSRGKSLGLRSTKKESS
jgi:hypothetical protein